MCLLTPHSYAERQAFGGAVTSRPRRAVVGTHTRPAQRNGAMSPDSALVSHTAVEPSGFMKRSPRYTSRDCLRVDTRIRRTYGRAFGTTVLAY
jgi:hypothetical protein